MRYLLITPIPFRISKEGDNYVEQELWRRDIQAHAKYVDELIILCPLDKEEETKGWAKVERGNISFKPLDYFRNWKELVKNIIPLIANIWRNVESAYICHCCGTVDRPIGILGLFIAKLRKKKTVFVLDADSVEDYKLIIREYPVWNPMRYYWIVRARLVKSLLGFCVRVSNITFTVGESLYSKYGNSAPGCVHKINASWISENDVVEKMVPARFPEKLKILFSSRLVHKKGAHILLSALSMLDSNINYSLEIYGTGPEEKNLRNIIKEKGLEHNIKLMGTLPYLEYLNTLRQIDVCVIPILSGELPRVLFDALSSGNIVIASKTAAIQDVIRHGENGLLFDPDNPHELAKLIEYAWKNTREAKALSSNGIEFMKGLTIEGSHRKRIKLIETLIK